MCPSGRVDLGDPAGPRLAWPGTAVQARFTGTRLHVRLQELQDAVYRHQPVNNYYDVLVDARPPIQLKTTRAQLDYPVVQDLPPGAHTVTLIKRTEANMGTVQFLGWGLGAGATLLPLPCPAARRRLLVLGDSTSAGYGVEAQDPNDPACQHVDAISNVRRTAGYLAAANLGAEVHVLAFSGRGVFRNGNPNDKRMLADMWTRSLPGDANSQWDASRWQPQAVVVNLGANDLKAEPPLADLHDVTAAYTALARQVRLAYPQAYLVLAVSPTLHPPLRAQMHAVLDAVSAELQAGGEARLSLLDFTEDDGTHGSGCDKHPNVFTQQAMAEQLTAHLRALLDWQAF